MGNRSRTEIVGSILCDCCFDNPKFRVPELNYHICNKKGLIPESLEIVLEKRLRYKKGL